MLHEAHGNLLCARLAALDAQLWLIGACTSHGGADRCSDARVKRAAELCEKVTDAVVHVDRLLFFIAGDIPGSSNAKSPSRGTEVLERGSWVSLGAGQYVS
jgi:hypothetical protein